MSRLKLRMLRTKFGVFQLLLCVSRQNLASEEAKICFFCFFGIFNGENTLSKKTDLKMVYFQKKNTFFPLLGVAHPKVEISTFFNPSIQLNTFFHLHLTNIQIPNLSTVQWGAVHSAPMSHGYFSLKKGWMYQISKLFPNSI